MSRILPSVVSTNSGSLKRKHSAIEPTESNEQSTKQSSKQATNRRSPDPAANQSDNLKTGFFSGCRFFIQCGSNISSKRRSLWTQSITQRGGEVVDTLDRKITHCILPTPCDYQSFYQSALQSVKKQKYVDRIQFHTDDWLVQSLKANKLCDESKFRIILGPQLEDDTPSFRSVNQSLNQSFSHSQDQLPDLEPFTQSSVSSLSSSSSQEQPALSAACRTFSELNPSPMSLPPLEFPSPIKQINQSVNPSLERSTHSVHSSGRSGRQPFNYSSLSPSVKLSSDKSVSRALFEPAVKKEEPAWTQSADQSNNQSFNQSDDDIELLIDPTVFSQSSNSLSSQTLKPHPYHSKNTDFLACQKSSSSLINHNKAITSVFERLEEMNGATGQKWKEMAYRKAVGIIKQYPKKIEGDSDFEKLRKIKGISDKFIEKMKEILRTGKMQKAEIMSSSELVKTLEIFTGIHGVGSVTARKWFDLGLRTLDELVADPRIELSAQQKVGLRFYHDKAKRIPRAEVQAIEQFVWLVADSLMSGIQVMCCGSYRRGKPASGDCDLLITHELFTDDKIGHARRQEFMTQLLNKLKASIEPPYTWLTSDINTGSVGQIYELEEEEDLCSFSQTDNASQSINQTNNPIVKQSSEAAIKMKQLKDDLPPSFPPFITGVLSDFDGLTSRHAQGTFMGFCCLPSAHPRASGINRRLDIKVYPRAMFPFALLYFTGSDHFNRSMRFYAKKSGWSLSDHGLSHANRVGGTKVMTSNSIYCETEKDIFRAMGLRYIPPTERNTYQAWEEAMGFDQNDQLAIKAEDGGPSDAAIDNDDAHSQTSESNLQPEDFYAPGYESNDSIQNSPAQVL